VTVKICVEGGGNDAYTLRICKTAFVRYCEKLVPPGKMPRIVACGSRNDTYNDFMTSVADKNYDLVGLLVDSEEPVVAPTTTAHLKELDGWVIPKDSSQTIFLMVQCMESWFIADRQTLFDYYDQYFQRNALPARTDVEAIPKTTLMYTLEHATRKCQKKKYHKTQHGFAILALLDPGRVEAASPHAKLFNNFLRGL
jgi:hypothetical protein